MGARNGVVAGQAACLYSLMRPSQRVVRTSRRGNGWPMRVVVIDVVDDEPLELATVPDDGAVEEPQGADPAFGWPSPASSPWMRRYPQVGFSAARRSGSRRISAEVDGRPDGQCGRVQCPTMRRRCQRNSVSGVTSHPVRLDRGSAAAIAASKLRSASVISGRSICRRSTANWWRNTMISRSFERPDRSEPSQ